MFSLSKFRHTKSFNPHFQLSPKGVQRPNRRDVKSVVAKARTRVAGSTAVLPLPPSTKLRALG
ncbi:hypothetical protein YC2023_036486 [Brassica napus]